MYANGQGVAKNLNEAQRLLKLAANQNEKGAADLLADVQRQSTQAPGQAQTQAQAYQGREKTILEQILNYTSFADENGFFDATQPHFELVGGFAVSGYWVSGEDGEDKCILTLHQTFVDRTMNNTNIKVDLRQFNESGFRFVRQTNGYIHWWIVGDENTSLQGDGRDVLERLQKAWGIAFEECPGKKSPF